MHTEGSYARVFAEEYFKKRKINKDNLNYIVIAQTTETIIECVANGLDLAILSEQVMKSYANKNKVLVYNCDFVENRTFYIAYKKDIDLSLKSKIFIDYAKKNLKHLFYFFTIFNYIYWFFVIPNSMHYILCI